jgi:hypothetical protein
MLEVTESSDRLRDDPMTGATLDVDQERYTARVVLESRVV